MTNPTATTTPQSGPRTRLLTRLVRRHPITAYLIVTFGLVWPGLGIPRLAGYSVAPERLDLVLSAMAFVVLFGAAVLVTAVVDGRPGIRRLLAGIVQWRIGVGRWLLVAGALPALTLAVAGATGTLHSPPEGWLRMGVTYLVTRLVGGPCSSTPAAASSPSRYCTRRSTPSGRCPPLRADGNFSPPWSCSRSPSAPVGARRRRRAAAGVGR